MVGHCSAYSRDESAVNQDESTNLSLMFQDITSSEAFGLKTGFCFLCYPHQGFQGDVHLLSNQTSSTVNLRILDSSEDAIAIATLVVAIARRISTLYV